jgi:hypothetical protein
MFRVEQQHAELLDWPRAVFGDEYLGGVDGSTDLEALAARPDEGPAAGFDRGNQLRRARYADARNPPQIVRRRTRQAVQAADCGEHGVGEFERTCARRAVPEHDGEQLVVAQHGRPRALELFPWAIVGRNRLHRRLTRSQAGAAGCYTFPVRRLLIVGGLILGAAACSGPPQKEIDQAQTALESARAAGADQYAASEYTEAASSLQKAHDAVDQRDYRQALNYAIDSRQRSQEALRLAPEGKGRARDAAVKEYDRTARRANELQSRLRDAETARIPAKDLQEARAALAAARQSLQEASATITAGNFEVVSKSLTEVRGKLDVAVQQIEKIPLRPARKKSGRI